MDWTDRTRPGKADMEGQNGSWAHGPVTDGQKRRKKQEEEEIPDRVTLKKEIGLLSACAIIIGEARRKRNTRELLNSKVCACARLCVRACMRVCARVCIGADA